MMATSTELEKLGSILGDDFISSDSAERSPFLAQVKAGMVEFATKPTDLSPLRLQGIKPTDELLDSLELLQLALIAAKGKDNRRKMRQAQSDIVDTERQIVLARERDRVARRRPPGCWCLGAGGKLARIMDKGLPFHRGYDDEAKASIIEVVRTLDEYCTCPEGVERQRTDAAAIVEYKQDARRRRVNRVLRESGLGDMDHYRQFAWRNHPDRRSVMQCAEWLDLGKPTGLPWLALYGPPGRGKTGIVAGMSFELAERGEGVIFTTVPKFLERCRSGFDPNSEQSESAYLDAFRNATVLVFDDIGSEKPTEYAGKCLLQVLDYRHNKMLRTIITSNLLPYGRFEDRGSQRVQIEDGLVDHVGERIFGRIKRMSHPIIMDGLDLRDTA